MLEWKENGNCAGQPPALFFPDKGANGREIAVAKGLCQACIVRSECLEYSLSSYDGRFGIWGGKTERERRAIKRRKVAA